MYDNLSWLVFKWRLSIPKSSCWENGANAIARPNNSASPAQLKGQLKAFRLEDLDIQDLDEEKVSALSNTDACAI